LKNNNNKGKLLMKKLIITGLLAFLISTTFLSDNPPGWYQQELPVNDVTKDISFTDSLNGWIITDGSFNNNDTGYIMRTTNGGANWSIQFDSTLTLNVIQFVDNDYGYAGGGFGRASFLKTTNGGINWLYSIASGVGAYNILDLKFVNKDTGWICSDDEFDGGVFKTINGGTNWQRQTTPTQLRPIKLFLINVDTGWALNPPNNSIYKTTNGGINWLFLNGISSGLKDLFFLSNDTGWIIRNTGNPNGILKTTNGGINWFVQTDPNQTGSGLSDIFILSNSKGWISAYFNKILSLKNDSVWGSQNSPPVFHSYFSIFMIDSSIGYSGGDIFLKTEDGGGVITVIENNNATIPEDYILYQNYPNPFNPKTIINYELRVNGIITFKIFDMQGRDLKTLVNKRQNPGEYKIEFDSSELSSGVYFYRIEGVEESTGRSFLETKKMMLIR
jgi:photosystem II stability/assembly factor-like uncharacterized protein